MSRLIGNSLSEIFFSQLNKKESQLLSEIILNELFCHQNGNDKFYKETKRKLLFK